MKSKRNQQNKCALQYREKLYHANIDNPEVFREMLVEGTDTLLLTDGYCAKLFGVPVPSVVQWKSGEQPLPIMKRFVQKQLLKLSSICEI